jgi:hypothetical protein
MLKGLMMGLLGISLVAILATEANAQIDGWGWFGFSAIRGEIDTIHTPNPQGQPSEITVMVTATIQIACINPANNGVFNGVAFHKPLTNAVPPGSGGFIDTKGNARTEVLIPLPHDQFEVQANCPNKNWTPITGSAMALDFSGTVLWCLLDKTGQPDCSKKGFLDQASVTCTLDTTLPENMRNSDGTAPHEAHFDCPQPQ